MSVQKKPLAQPPSALHGPLQLGPLQDAFPGHWVVLGLLQPPAPSQIFMVSTPSLQVGSQGVPWGGYMQRPPSSQPMGVEQISPGGPAVHSDAQQSPLAPQYPKGHPPGEGQGRLQVPPQSTVRTQI